MNMRLRRTKRTSSPLFIYIILTVLAVFSLYPILMLVFNSLKTVLEIGANPLSPPNLREIHFDNYLTAWTEGRYAVTFKNSAIIAAGSIFGVLFVAGLAAYSLARIKPKGSGFMIGYFLISSALPSALFLFPLFFLWKQLGLINNFLGIIIIHVARFSTFATFLLRAYMVLVPQDFEDAAVIDGASKMQILSRIILPICKPGFLTVGLIIALWAWNEFMFAVTFIHDQNMKPVSTSLYSFMGQYSSDWNLINAASVLMLVPAVLLFLIFQRKFIEGMTAGGIKG